MAFTPSVTPGRQVIQAYGDGGFRIAGAVFSAPVLVLPDATVPWTVTRAEEAAPENLEPIIAFAPAIEILVLGGGARSVVVESATGDFLRGHGIALEAMPTGAACRTYNVLLAEDRRVAAALIPVP